MSVSKRTRYEVLRRDGYACRYCGGRAPDVALTVDHVIPTALGGSDDPSNLVAACRDCNAGKAASSPDAVLVAQVDQDALRWAAAIRKAAEAFHADQDAAAAYCERVATSWDLDDAVYRHGRGCSLPDDWVDTVEQWRTLGLPVEMVVDAIGIAMRKKTIPARSVWRYVCGICWTRLRELQDDARALLAEGASR